MDGTSSTVSDPVCNMEIDPKEAAGKREYQGRTSYFCAPSCKQAFDRNPKHYVSRQAK